MVDERNDEEKEKTPEGSESTSSDDQVEWPAGASAKEVEPNDPTDGSVTSEEHHEIKALPGWTKKAVVGVAVVIVAAILYVNLYHDWGSATCTEPQRCKICGKTQGDALGHDYADATCTKPRTCKRCGEADGDALGHEVPADAWIVDVQATCTEQGSEHGNCKRCGERQTKTIPLVPHTEGEPQITTEATVDASGNAVAGEKTICCSVCGAKIRTEKYSLSPEEIASMFKEACETPGYEDVARNPDDWEGKKVAFRGKVIQTMQDGNGYTLRVNVTEGRYGLWDDTILVSYAAKSGEARILEDDIMTFYGTMKGMYSYKSVLGATITVPLLIASYAE